MTATALPVAGDFTGSAVTEADFKTAVTDLRAYLAGLLGADGEVATALAALGALGAATSAKSGAYTVATADRGKAILCTGTWTLSLPAAATAGDGFAFVACNSGSGVITLDGSGSETVDGETTVPMAPGASFALVCDGSAWRSVGRQTGGVLQTASDKLTTSLTTTKVIPYDTSIPLITEGEEVLSISLTPINASTKIAVQVNIPVTSNTVPTVCVLWRDSTPVHASYGSDHRFSFIEDAGSTSARTYSIRIGPSSSSTMGMNGTPLGGTAAGLLNPVMIIQEVL